MSFRPTVAVVDLDAIAHNARRLKPSDAELMAVVKADAYGHGAVPVARTALAAGASWLAVALVEEGLDLRDAGVEAPILVLTEVPRGAEKDALAAGLTPTVYTGEGIARLAAAGSAGAIRCHLKVDTGMHRVGARPEDALPLCRDAAEHGLEVEGIWTHLAVADEVGHEATRGQLERFSQVVEALRSAGFDPRYRHAANSAAALTLPEARFDLVRAGIALYGIAPSSEVGSEGLRRAMSLRSRVAFVKRVEAGEALSYGLRYRLERDAWIATVPIGYADGYTRRLSGRGRVLVRGVRRPIAGTVTMDQILVDCGDEEVAPGEEVVLFGRQGHEEITAEEVAEWSGTIGYEVVCAVGARVPREHRGGA